MSPRRPRFARRARPATLLLALALALALAAGAPAAAVRPHQRTSLTAVWNDYMCVLCHEPLPVAQSQQASDERQLIQRLAVEGDNPAQIKRVMVSQYGPAVLATPPAHGFNLAIYIVPPVLVIIGLAVLFYTLPKWRARARLAAAEAAVDPAPEPEDEDAVRLERELSRFD